MLGFKLLFNGGRAVAVASVMFIGTAFLWTFIAGLINGAGIVFGFGVPFAVLVNAWPIAELIGVGLAANNGWLA